MLSACCSSCVVVLGLLFLGCCRCSFHCRCRLNRTRFRIGGRTTPVVNILFPSTNWNLLSFRVFIVYLNAPRPRFDNVKVLSSAVFSSKVSQSPLAFRCRSSFVIIVLPSSSSLLSLLSSCFSLASPSEFFAFSLAVKVRSCDPTL